LWSTVANADAYKNGGGDFLDCRVGLGTAVEIDAAGGGPNLDVGCNLKSAAGATPVLATPADLP
jgi:hypothetical protein